MITLPEPGDVQVATAWPEVNAYRAACWNILSLRHGVIRAVHYEKWMLDTYLTTTKAGREGRAQATALLAEARQDLATAEDELPALAAAAEQVVPAAAERARLSVREQMANRAQQKAWRENRHD